MFFRRKLDSKVQFEQAFEQLQVAEATYGALDRKYAAQWYELTDRVKDGLREGQPKSVLRSLCRRRKLLTTRREQLLFQKDHLFQKRLRLEQMSLTASHASGLKAVLSVCREMAKELDSDEVDKMMDEMTDLNDVVEDAQAVLTETTFEDLDDDELEVELRTLRDAEPVRRPSTATDLLLPKVPLDEVETQRTGLLQEHRKRVLAQ